MWSDDATSQDFLNFGVLARVIAGAIHTNGDRPLSIGVSGAWGVGKSTTLELLAAELEQHEPKPLIVRFHPWRHQTQDNVRAAFAECIAQTLVDNKDVPTKVAEKAKSILKRANLIRIAGYGLGGALTLATGIPVGGFFARGTQVIGGLIDGDVTKDDVEKGLDFSHTTEKKFTELFPDDGESESPYQNVEKICQDFADALEALDRRLIVLIDDLDRCLPHTTIEALEAMRLYFFVPRTVFVVAADEEMLRLAVRKHFEVSDQTLDEAHLQSYYDKLIQLPFRIPSLTVPDAIVYMALLVLEQQPDLSSNDREQVRSELCDRLAQTWDGTRITREAIMTSVGTRKVSDDFENRISLIERLAPRMVSSKKIGGNPRLIKRFMNSLLVQDALAKAIAAPSETNEEVLAKVLLLQRCGDKELVNELQRDVLRTPDGRSAILAQLENASLPTLDDMPDKGDEDDAQTKRSSSVATEVSELWSSGFAKEWILMEPPLAEIDLRLAFHVSRGADEAFTQPVKLSEETRALLDALRKTPQVPEQFKAQIGKIPEDEVPTAMNALVNHLRTCRDDFRDVLRCCVTFETIHLSQSSLLKSALTSIDPNRLDAAAVVVFAKRPWAGDIQKHLQQELGPSSPAVKALLKSMEK